MRTKSDESEPVLPVYVSSTGSNDAVDMGIWMDQMITISKELEGGRYENFGDLLPEAEIAANGPAESGQKEIENKKPGGRPRRHWRRIGMSRKKTAGDPIRTELWYDTKNEEIRYRFFCGDKEIFPDKERGID